MRQPQNFDSSGSIQTPIGLVSVFETDGAITNLFIGGQAADNAEPSPLIKNALQQLADYFAGKRRDLSFDVRAVGTEFQEAVWGQIAKVPFGQTITYSQIAEAIGKPLAARAVGGAVGANPVPLVIGCHRVMGSSGRITGYSSGDGIPTKRWLLNHEGIESND